MNLCQIGNFLTKIPGLKARWESDILKHTICYLSNRPTSELARPAKVPAFCHQPGGDKVEDMKTPQQLSREAIEEFKAIYQAEFGQTLSDDEVQEIALRLLRFFGILNKANSGENI